MSEKTAIVAEKAPAALGPYSAAIRKGNMLFCAGQTPIVPETGELAEGCAGCQTRQVLTNVQAVLEAAGATLDDVVKSTVFLSDMEHFPKMNKVYEEFFSAPYPARSTVAVKGLPVGAMVEIEVLAVLD